MHKAITCCVHFNLISCMTACIDYMHVYVYYRHAWLHVCMHYIDCASITWLERAHCIICAQHHCLHECLLLLWYAKMQRAKSARQQIRIPCQSGPTLIHMAKHAFLCNALALLCQHYEKRSLPTTPCIHVFWRSSIGHLFGVKLWHTHETFEASCDTTRKSLYAYCNWKCHQ